MKKQITKIITVFTIALLGALLLCACGRRKGSESSFDALKDKLSKQQEEASDEAKQKPAKQADESVSASDASVEVDLDSEDAILKFLAGEWAFLDRETGEDFATLTVSADGSLTFMRLSDHKSADGRIAFEPRYAAQEGMPLQFRLRLDDITEVVPQGAADYADPFSETSGTFHIGSGADTDYLFLTELGNGDTMISLYVFNTHPGEMYYDVPTWSNEWLFYRKNEGHALKESKKNADFYAWIWNRGTDGSVMLQEMDPYAFDTVEDYTERAYRGAYFEEQPDIRLESYAISDQIDTTQLYDEKGWNDAYPLDVFSIQTDDAGEIVSVRDVDDSYYGIYDLGALDPVFSNDDRNFYYNDATFSIEDFAPGANAVMGCERVGNWIIVDCHVNPHVGLYELFNINNGFFQYEIAGVNLIWQGDDLSTAVYSRFGEVYDFWGNMIGGVDDGEVANLSFASPGEILVEYWQNGSADAGTQQAVLEYEPVDSELLLYYDFLLSGHRPSQWRTFMSKAPHDAVAYVIINPPEALQDWLPAPASSEGGLDTLAVISLYDGETIHIDTNEANYMDFHAQNRTDAVAYSLTVPEGMPVETLLIRMQDGREITWPIWTISGRIPQRTIFLPAK